MCESNPFSGRFMPLQKKGRYIISGKNMNFGKSSTDRKIKVASSSRTKYTNKVFLHFGKTLFIASIFFIVMFISLGIGVFKGIIDSAPNIDVESIMPLGFATTVYDSRGNVTNTLVMAGSNREAAEYEEIPKHLVDSFIAIEDERFWKHNGIDTKSIMRAIVGIITGKSSSGGGSTITQQLIKNNIFSGGMEKTFAARLERKIQEQYLALKIEKVMTKEVIITNYLNTINLGKNSLGVKVAARRYFGKEVSDLTLSESAVLAAITKSPGKLNPISGPEANASRRDTILKYMVKQGLISETEREEALADNVYARIQDVDTQTKENKTVYSYFTDELIEQVEQALVEELGYSDTQAQNALFGGGLSIYTTQDPDLQKIVDEEVNNPENYSDVKYALEWRYTIVNTSGNIVNYSEESVKKYHRDVGDDHSGLYNTIEEAQADVDYYKSNFILDVAEEKGETFHTILEPQISFVLIEQKTGEVKAINGGRGEKLTSRSLNRATNVTRQPGSTFKVLAAFGPAIDAKNATLATVYYDAPYSIGKKEFSNWYEKQGYLGWSNIREGIIYSMNIVAVKAFMETVTPKVGLEYAKNLGITTLTDADYVPAAALGGLTNGVSNLELTGAFSAIGNGGMFKKPIFFTKIVDHNGKTLIDNTDNEGKRVLKDSTSFLLTDAMAASMEANRKFSRAGVSVNSTSTKAHLDNMSAAGKSGTTTSNRDVWFVGYTPYYTAGVWAGYDHNQKLDSTQGETSFHKVIWKKIMDRAHVGKENIGFSKPDSVETAVICRKSGKLPIPGVCSLDPRGDATYLEYFARGSTPTEVCDHHIRTTVCAVSGQKPGPYCPVATRVATVTPDGDTSDTDDTSYSSNVRCSIHLNAPAPQETTNPENPNPSQDNSDVQTNIIAPTAGERGPAFDRNAGVVRSGPGYIQPETENVQVSPGN